MKEKKIKLYIDCKISIICACCGISLLVILSAVFFIIGIFVHSNIIGGYIFLACAIVVFIITLISLCKMYYLEIDNYGIVLKNYYGKIKSEYQWEQLKSIERRKLVAFRNEGKIPGDYLVLNFSFNTIEDNTITGLMQADNVQILMYSKKHEKILKQFTDIPIIDCRLNQRKAS